VAIGLILIYCLLSIVNSALKEGIESWVKKRAIDLERGIWEILHDKKGDGLAKAFYDHPLICGLYRGEYTPSRWRITEVLCGSNLPSYIPAGAFASTLLELALGPNPQGSVEELNTKIDRCPGVNEPIKRILKLFVAETAGDVAKLRERIETWFNSAM